MTYGRATWAEAAPDDALRDVISARDWYPRLPWQRHSVSIAALPGDALTREAIGREERRRALISLVYRFAIHGLSWTADQTATIPPATAVVAEAFFDALPANKALPKISPDGEDGLMMVWEGSGDPLLVTLDGVRLHAVIAATTPYAEYLNDVPFDCWEIPAAILTAIPSR
jgi:hypothetical protein